MARLGNQADLARERGISRQAVSKQIKKHCPQMSLVREFDLDYVGFLIGEGLKKSNAQVRSEGQKRRARTPVSVKDPQVIRSVAIGLMPLLEQSAKAALRELKSTGFTDEELCLSLESFGVWYRAFFAEIDREHAAGLVDFEFTTPPMFAVDVSLTDELAALDEDVENG